MCVCLFVFCAALPRLASQSGLGPGQGQRAKLSDMGLSKQLVAEQSSFESHGAGAGNGQALWARLARPGRARQGLWAGMATLGTGHWARHSTAQGCDVHVGCLGCPVSATAQCGMYLMCACPPADSYASALGADSTMLLSHLPRTPRPPFPP